MMKKSIFKASFEESKNLFKDGLASLQNEQHNNTLKYIVDGQFNSDFKILAILFTFLFPVGFNLMLVSFSSFLHSNDDDLKGKASLFRFLTWETWVTLFIVWIVLIIIGKRFKQTYILPYRYHFHTLTYLMTLCIEISMIGLEIASSNISLFTTIFLVTAVLLVLSIMFWITPTTIRKILYGNKESLNSRNKLAQMITAYGMGILALGIILKNILGFLSIGVSDDLEKLGIIALCLASIDLGLGYILFFELPYLLCGYYMIKYPEQYRLLNGKSVQEWYGPKYLKKHPELLANPQYHGQK